MARRRTSTAARVGLAALALTLAAAATACSSGSTSSGDTTTTTAAPSATTTTTPSTTTTIDLDAAMEAALLTPADIGPGFTAQPDPGPADPDQPAPCGTPNAAASLPTVLVGSMEAQNAAGTLGVLERIDVYSSDAQAREAYGIAVTGLSCTTGAFGDGEVVQITPAGDISANLGIPYPAQAWDLQVPSVGLVMSVILVQVDNLVLGVQLFAEDQAAAGLDPFVVAKTAVDKLEAEAGS